MRLIAFDKNGTATMGARDGESVVDLSIAAPDLPGDLTGIIKLGQAGIDKIAAAVSSAGDDARVSLDSIKYLPPIDQCWQTYLPRLELCGPRRRRRTSEA